jgi:hypothetical protein
VIVTQYGPVEWWYADGVLASNQRAAIFGPGNDNVFAPIFADAGMTIPLANPTLTDGAGLLTFYAPDGAYWIFVGPVGSGDSVLVNLGAAPGAVDSVNGQTGVVVLGASDVGAQPIGTIDAKGDLYVGTGPDATDRLAAGVDGLVLTTDSAEPVGMKWAAGGGGGAVTSVNGQVGAVVLDAGDVGADVAGAAAAAASASQPIGTIDAKGDLYVGTANDATARQAVGADGQVLTADSSLTNGLKWAAPASAPVSSVNGQTGAVVLSAANVGAPPTSRNLTAGIALSGGGDLSADRTFDVDLGTTGGTVAEGNDSRIVGAQQRSTLTTKGDLYAATGAATVIRRGIGADGQVLTADAAQTDGIKWATPASAPVSSVNGQVGVVVLGAADVGADAAGAAAAVAAASQALATIDAKGDLYAGTADNTTARRSVGTNGQVLTADSTQATGLNWTTPTAAPVSSVNGQTGAVVLTAADVGAQPITTIDAKGDLYAGTGADTTSRLAVGTDGQALRANSAIGTGLEWHTFTASDVGADPIGSAAAAQAASQPLDSDLTAIAGLAPPDDDIIQRKGGLWVARTMAQVKADLAITAADVGAVPTARTITAGTALSGGGDLSANRTFDVVLGTSGTSAAAGNDSRIVGAQQKSDLTAKGDLYVATASATIARQGVGTNGQVLTADSAVTNGLKWATPATPGGASFAVQARAAYHQVGGVITVRSSKAVTLNAMYLEPMPLLNAATLTSIAIELTSSTANAVVRFGVYASNANNLPDALVADFGTFAAATSGALLTAVSQALSAGVNWLAICFQTAAPSARHGAGFNPYVSSAAFPAGTGTGWDNAYVQTGVTGTLPANTTIGSLTDTDSPFAGVKF